ncbi:putative late blight resistance protein-like protein R1B-12 [Forsythia ovata]|uniref:Late blight resistance protein-like protein R1B-12 n=1 Tax=Forsythia ovata TaxID=205694 RepID=A0ABD1WHZ9_9LAMI
MPPTPHGAVCATLLWKASLIPAHVAGVVFHGVKDYYVLLCSSSFPGSSSEPRKLIGASVAVGNGELVVVTEIFLGQRYLSVFLTVQMNPLLKKLKFLLFIIGDTPFRCTEIEETKNILAKIELIANEAGIFFHSFFFTKNLVKEMRISEAMQSILLLKFKMVKEKIKKHCVTFSNQPSVTTRNTALDSISIVDSVLDYLSHLINNKASLIVDVKDQITTLHEELNFSRSFLRDIDVQQNKGLFECEMQLRDLAYEAKYIINWCAAGEVPIWYLTLRLSNFVKKNKLIRTALPEIKLNYGIDSLEVVESPCEVSFQVDRSIPMVDEIIVGLKKLSWA